MQDLESGSSSSACLMGSHAVPNASIHIIFDSIDSRNVMAALMYSFQRLTGTSQTYEWHVEFGQLCNACPLRKTKPVSSVTPAERVYRSVFKVHVGRRC
jgi:hypothetical protein